MPLSYVDHAGTSMHGIAIPKKNSRTLNQAAERRARRHRALLRARPSAGCGAAPAQERRRERQGGDGGGEEARHEADELMSAGVWIPGARG